MEPFEFFGFFRRNPMDAMARWVSSNGFWEPMKRFAHGVLAANMFKMVSFTQLISPV